MAFKPWVGPQYHQGIDGLRLLILGESHYTPGDIPVSDEFTSRVIEHHALRPEAREQFFTKVAKVVSGSEVRQEFRHIWDRVAFYNYIQESVGTTSRLRPTDAMWKAAELPFSDVLASLAPDIVLVLGYSLWEHMPPPYQKLDCVGGKPLKGNLYRYSGGEATAACVAHPSSGRLRYVDAEEVLKALKVEAKVRSGS